MNNAHIIKEQLIKQLTEYYQAKYSFFIDTIENEYNMIYNGRKFIIKIDQYSNHISARLLFGTIVDDDFEIISYQFTDSYIYDDNMNFLGYKDIINNKIMSDYPSVKQQRDNAIDNILNS